MAQQNTSQQENQTQEPKDYSKPLQEREIEHVKGTPFSISRMGKGEPWRISIGNQLMDDKGYKRKWVARMRTKKISWEMIWRVGIAINLKMKEK